MIPKAQTTKEKLKTPGPECSSVVDSKLSMYKALDFIRNTK
jgi:hypothetical protein